jgi:hypothetical protein
MSLSKPPGGSTGLSNDPKLKAKYKFVPAFN